MVKVMLEHFDPDTEEGAYVSRPVNLVGQRRKEDLMEKQIHTVGERAQKLCAVCNEERGHVVASVNIRGQISRVSCPKCGTLSAFKLSARTALRPSVQPCAPYDQMHTYRTGQAFTHPTYGEGEVTALVEPRKIDVLFSDRVRRLIHARAQ